jgi:hypothetical protein
LEVEGHNLHLTPSYHHWFPVLTDRKIFVIGLRGNGEPFRKALNGYHDPPVPRLTQPPPDATWIGPTITAETTLTATVQFTDLNGNTWQRTASNKAVSEDRLDESLRIEPVQRVR